MKLLPESSFSHLVEELPGNDLSRVVSFSKLIIARTDRIGYFRVNLWVFSCINPSYENEFNLHEN